MDAVFFACRQCRMMADAGHQWAFHELINPGIVRVTDQVNVDAVLDATSYWSPPANFETKHLIDAVLPSVRSFLETHRDHNIIFGDKQSILGGDYGFDWLDVGYLPELSPRFLVERLGLESWDEVCDFVARSERKPWWWNETFEGIHDAARTAFEEMMKRKRS